MTDVPEDVIPGGAIPKVVHSPIAEQKKKQDSKLQKRQTDQKISAYTVRRQAVISKLQRIKDVLGNATYNTVHHLDMYLRRVDSCYDEYNTIQNQLYSEFPDARDQQEGYFVEFEQAYEEIRVDICVAIEALRCKDELPGKLLRVPPPLPMPIPQQPVNNQTPALPQIPLPVFDGAYEKWFRFKQLFQDIMQKYPGLSDATKLHYLQQGLKGKAENVLTDQILNENNFQAAWNALIERFENKRTIIDVHVGGLFNMRKMNKESSSELRQLVDDCKRHVEALEFHKQKMLGMSEQLIVSLLTSKLDKVTLSLWENSVKPKELPTFKETMEFLQNRCFVLERCEASTTRGNEPSKLKPSVPVTKTPLRVHTAQQSTEESCAVCDGDHIVNKCNVLKQLPLSERLVKVKEKQLCFNCLKRGHRVRQCKARNCTVSGCGRKHNTLLHYEEMTPSEKPIPTESATPQKQESTVSETSSSATSTSTKCEGTNKKHVILSTAIVEVKDCWGAYRPCRVLLDSGSQSNFLSEHIAKQLRLKRETVQVPVVGINSEKMVVTQQVSVRVKSTLCNTSWLLDFLVVPQVTGNLPNQKLDVTHWKIPSELPLADPRFNVPAKIDMLLGAEIYFELMQPEHLKIADGQATFWKTKLGWIISGTYSGIHRPIKLSAVACHQEIEDDLESLVKRFWEQEEIPETPKPQLSDENKQCLDHFARTHRRENGRFVVRLPFRSNVGELGETRSLAKRRFLQLERRLDLQPELKSQYTTFMREYISLGHCSRIDDAKASEQNGCYLPHHAVLRPSSSTTQIRVVYNASARSDTNLSLNDVLQTGPVVQDNLAAILLRFRTYKFVFTADVIKMYRQIFVDELDTPYLKIFWRENYKDKLETYELKTVTYGTSCAPFCATACLKQLADDEAADFPLGAKVVRKDFYIDDVLTGANDLQTALDCQTELIAILKRGGFDLHKWCANSPLLLERIAEKDQQTQRTAGDCYIVKTLGLLWNPSADTFLFDVKASSEVRESYTKRIVLSDTAKIFDPHGLLEPVTVAAKLFVQELWALGVGWDEPLKAEQEEKWKRFKKDLLQVNEMNIPRRVTADDVKSFEIHGFADASKKAYGACVYLRCLKSDGTVEVNLISSKTRVSPLPVKPGSRKSRKPFTIPRAELCGALLLSKLTVSVIESLNLKIDKVVLSSDSQIVLCWLTKPLDLLEVFVANKVREINQLTQRYEWRYISSDNNPADLASRGVSPLALKQSTLWWQGPPMLQNADYVYNQVDPVPFDDQELELQDAEQTCTVLQLQPWDLLTRFQNFRRLQRVVAYVYRFLNNCREKLKVKRSTGGLTVPELRSSTLKIVGLTQKEMFAEEIKMLKAGNTKKSKLLSLSPFVDADGLLRVGGRLKHAKIPLDRKHQLLLPAGHHVTKSLIQSLHKEHLHVGQQGLLAIVRQRYWPVKGRSVVRQIVKRCIRCFRMNPPETIQFMGNLPDYRVTPAPVFNKTGIDYAGPIFIKQGNRRPARIKAYVALFICMSTKAIHLEVVSDLSTEAFLAALTRFIGRRGVPERLISDNATNFRGAQSQLQELYNLFRDQQATTAINNFCVAEEIQWSFIPPRSPNFGGIWEAGVKAAKSLLKKILCESFLTFEELTTVMIRIEAVLNSRPLTQLSNDPNDLRTLTPGHFLIGRELTAAPEPSYSQARLSSLSRWEHLRKQAQDFWVRWSSEYLSELQPRGKWYKDKLIIAPGMLVVIREDNMAPQQWRLGRIVQVHPGTDGVVRVVTIKTANGETKRAVSKIAILPLENETNKDPSVDTSVNGGWMS